MPTKNKLLKVLLGLMGILWAGFQPLIAQKKNYEDDWKKVTEFEQQGLPKSANEIVEKIYEKSKIEKNSPQQVKSILYKIIYKGKAQDDAKDTKIALNDLDKEIKDALPEAKPLLYAMGANLYLGYYQQNRWQFSARLPTNVKNEDIETWDTQKIVQEALKYARLSLENPEFLQKIKIDEYFSILTKGTDDSRKLRPTLYDFLAHNNIQILSNAVLDITQPKYQFTIDKPEYLAESSIFAGLKLETKDELSYTFEALKIYQELTKFHLKDENPTTSYELELERINWVNSKATFQNKTEIWKNTIENFAKRTEKYPIYTELQYLIASEIYSQGISYNVHTNPKNKEKILTAKKIAENAINKFPKSKGAIMCENLINGQILAKSLQIQAEKYLAPNQNFSIFIQYRNLQKVYGKVIKTTRKEYNEWVRKNYDNQQNKKNLMIDFYRKTKAINQWETSLVDENDYQPNSIQEKISGLGVGFYVVLLANNADFSYNDNVVAYTTITLTDVSISTNTKPEGDIQAWITNRHTGEALTGRKVEVYRHYYNYNNNNGTERYVKEKINTLTIDKNGMVLQPYENSVKSFDTQKYGTTPYISMNVLGEENFSTIDENEDTYYTNIYASKYTQQIQNLKYGEIFIDRGIYRPAQTIYFKAILLEKEGKTNKILPNEQYAVGLFDANGQQVNSLDLKTNQYGAISGQFVLPSAGMTGSFTLRVGNLSIIDHAITPKQSLKDAARQYGMVLSQLLKLNPKLNENSTLKEGEIIKVSQMTNVVVQKSFNVEEYKRPKFEVNFEVTKGVFRLNDEITAKGTAKAFSGANIDGANVKYRIVRQARYSHWWYYRYNASPEMEIGNGEVKTNEKGEFFVKFKAIPDLSLSPEGKPLFSYQVYADVVDINGETRSGTTSVQVGYHALLLSSSLPEEWQNNEKNSCKINVTNLNGNPENAKVNVTFEKLIVPKITYKSKYWERPTKYIYTQEQWQKLLPNDVYDDENNHLTWKTDKIIFQKIMDTQKNAELSDEFKKLSAGKYKLTLSTQDSFGQNVESVQYVTINDENASKLAIADVLNISTIKESGEAGEKAKILVASSEEKLFVKYEIYANGKVLKQDFLTLDNNQKVIEVSLEKEYENYQINFMTTRHNRFYQQNATAIVLHPEREMDITWETFRDKLEPGQKDQWRIRIKGKKGEKIASEMVATLYDASLDQFANNSFNLGLRKDYFYAPNWANQDFGQNSFTLVAFDFYKSAQYVPAHSFDGWGAWYHQMSYLSYYNYGNYYRRRNGRESDMVDEMVVSAPNRNIMKMESKSLDMSEKSNRKMAEEAPKEEGKREDSERLNRNEAFGGVKSEPQKPKSDLSGVKARTNFSETAFFFPHLTTDENGDILINFTMPEALTRWKMLGLAHTKDLKIATTTKTLVTQKTLMVTPNVPRFLRENDKIILSTKITSLAEKTLKGEAQLFLSDALTGKNIDILLKNNHAQKTFEVLAGQSTALNWEIEIPLGTQAVTYKFVAKADNFSDGEESILPVLTNRMLVTETLPLPIRSNQTKNFKLEKLVSNKSTTLVHHNLSVEFTSNPAWYAVQALPYMMEYPYECAEQLFSRYYANSIASHIANSTPKIKQVFEKWKNLTPEAFLSNLDKNQELKNILIEETPWLRNANNEQERKRQLGVLLDLNRMANEMQTALDKLQKKQVASGAWVWFEGMPEDRYITQHIASGMGHLDKLKVKNIREDASTWQMIQKAVLYLDRKLVQDYEELLKYCKQYNLKLEDQHIGYLQLQYLYMRSFFINDWKIDKNTETAFSYYKGQTQKYWLSFNLGGQAMIGLCLHRLSDSTTPSKILKSLREKSINKEEMGMYWKQEGGYYWYEAPIETQALMIELFSEVAKDDKAVDDLKTWLIKQKQTTDWKTTRATAEACYALLLQGENWLTSDKLVQVSLNNQNITPAQNSPQVEAGTGYYKVNIPKEKITSEMGNIVVKKEDVGVSWGAMYWQYFEQLDKITPAETPLKIKKQLFIEKTSDRGNILTEITPNNVLKVGDLVKVRIEIRVDRNMEYVHLKDMRASGFEPTNVISQTKYQDGLYYYESTRDVATNFFIGYLPKGTYVFQYDLRVAQAGDFSNGITQIQCLYAPEFSSHSEGIRVKIER
jgi:uncharacterized protein YfaS (alpha-2-macroglobulin family)